MEGSDNTKDGIIFIDDESFESSERSVKFFKYSFEEEQVQKVERKVQVFQKRISETQERLEKLEGRVTSDSECLADSLKFCARCDKGPECCVDSERGIHTPDGGPDASTGCLISEENQDAKYTLQEEEEDDEDEDVISFYLGDGDSHGAVAEYEFFIDDDDEDESDEKLFDDESENATDNRVNIHYNDEEEYCVDDDDEEQFRNLDSFRDKIPCYQEPLEVILEILGEEGDEDGCDGGEDNGDNGGNDKGSKGNKKEENKLAVEEDLIVFSSSGEFSPDSLEEYPALSKEEASEAQELVDIGQSISGPSSLLDTGVEILVATDDMCVSSHMYTPGSSIGECEEVSNCSDIYISNVSAENIMDTAVPCEDTGSDSPNFSGCEEDMSDRDKLKSLTSEIEAYLRETTQLLESATTYTATVAKAPTKSSDKDIDGESSKNSVSRTTSLPVAQHHQNIKSVHMNCRHSFPGNTSSHVFANTRRSESTHSNIYPLNSSMNVADFMLKMPPSASQTTAAASQETNSANIIQPTNSFQNISDKEPMMEAAPVSINIIDTEMSVFQQATNIKTTQDSSIPYFEAKDNPLKESDNQSDSPSFASLMAAPVADLTSSGRTDYVSFSRPIAESHETFHSFQETNKFAESHYTDAVEASASAEVMEALDWDAKNAAKRKSTRPRIIYRQSPVVSDDDYFMSPTNVRKGWLEAFEELEDSLDATIKDDPPVFEFNLRKPEKELEASTDSSDVSSISPKITKSGRPRPPSPPPTVSCLENLEKLCKRLSQEHEKYSEEFCHVERPSPIGMETFEEHPKYANDPSNNLLGTNLMQCVSADSKDASKQEDPCTPRKNQPLMGVRHLQRIASLVNEDTNNQRETDNKLFLRGSTLPIENGTHPFLKENVSKQMYFYEGDTNKTSINDDIANKVEDLFKNIPISSTESSVVVNKSEEQNPRVITDPIRNNKPIPYVGNSVEPSSQDKDEIQKELVNILDGLDFMYEKYLEKQKQFSFIDSSKEIQEAKVSSKDMARENVTERDSNKRRTRSSESDDSTPVNDESVNEDAFQDILNVSEDLKHLCVFHVNKPDWSSDVASEHVVSEQDNTAEYSSGEQSDIHEENFPDFYESDGATPEGEFKVIISDEHINDHSTKSASAKEDRYEMCPSPDLTSEKSSKPEEGESSGSHGSEAQCEVDVSGFLSEIKGENQRCYEVTFSCLRKIITAATSAEGDPNLANSLLQTTRLHGDSPFCHKQNMSALQLAAEGRDYLMWCPDQEFDHAVSALDIRGLVELVQTLQDAMAVEQQTFDSLTQQLELVNDPLQQQRLSAALCTSQTRLARLCSRNMRCFTQQALKARQKEGSESRSSSPRDSGLVVSSAAASDAEGDPRSPTGASFKHSLAFFQRAANLVANNAKNSRVRQKEARRRSSRGSSCYGSSSSEAWSVTSDDPVLDLIAAGVAAGEDMGGADFEDDLANLVDQGTYEQVLFINGRPQYQDDLRSSHSSLLEAHQSSSTSSSPSNTTIKVQQEHSSRPRHSSPSPGERSRSGSWTRVRIDGSSSNSGNSVVAAAGGTPDSHLYSVPLSHGSQSRRTSPAAATTATVATDTTAASEAQTQTQEGDIGSYVTLPRRKPYLNFKSVSCGSNNSSNCVSSEFDADDVRYFKEKIGILKNSGVNTITRTQSFKEGLNCYSQEYSNSAYGLLRTQSFNDGLASDFNELESGKPRLQRAPSVDEILESVKSLRAKTMVKSNPDLLSGQEPVYHSASLPRHKSSKGKAPRPPCSSSLLGVRYNGSSPNDSLYERMPEPDYEQIPDVGTPYYENLCRGNNHYENIHLKGEVIYDSPRPTSEHRHYDKVRNDHYENVKFDAPVYENLEEKEPTYMNIKSSGGKSNVYANLENNKKSGSIKSSKSRPNKVTISGNSTIQGSTYDVPRAATHIYDSPQRQVRSVVSPQASEYDTPKNNRSVLPQSTQIVLQTKTDQKQKIDDIFADCDKDSLEGDRDREPDIPSPDYGSEEEGDGYEDASNDYVNAEFPDEGLGESDTRSYYTEDPAGLEVILEEPEEDYCSSHASEDDLRRDVDITYELKGERRSLDGSEGIGSAEGDTHSSGGSEHYVEEDCASSGIHSEDTPSPDPPVEAEKEEQQREETLQEKSQQKREEERIQKDRCIEVYPETVRQRQRNMMASPHKVDIKNWNSAGGGNNNNEIQTSPSKVKKFLPSVKALRNQFETGKNNNNRAETNGNSNNCNNNSNLSLSRKSSSSSSSLASSTLEKTSSTNSLSSTCGSMENLLSPSSEHDLHIDPDEPVEPIYKQFKKMDEELREMMSKPPSTTGWNPRPLLKRLYYIPEAPKMQSQGTTYVNIEGYLEKLPSGRKKATFWNAWKRRYFVAKDGVLYYYQSTQADKPSMKMTLMGGKVECMEPNMVGVDDGSRDPKAGAMIGIDDGKGHYVVVRCSSRQEAERWKRALETHTVEDFASQYVQPWPVPTNPALLRDTLVIDLGSSSVRAGVLASQATLPQVFLPSVAATDRETRRQIWGFEALAPDVRASSSISFPVRPSHKISKYSVDLSAVSSLLQKSFADLRVDPKNYHVQLSVPRVLNTNTQTELLRLLFDKYGVKSVNLTHQSILALYAYNATSGIIVDIGERMDIVPVIDGYIVDGGVSRVPYGGYRILDHLRQFLYMRNISLINEVDSYIIRHVLENICYCAHHYNTEKARCTNNPDNFEKGVSLAEYFQTKDCPFDTISLDFGRFQATEGLFNPDAWGLDHPGLHKLVHKAIMECSMDIRKEMSRSIFLAGGVTQLPGLVERLTTEIDNLTPPAIRPKVHASPYRYHAAYLGACVLAESPAFVQSRISREDWNKHGNAALRKWSL